LLEIKTVVFVGLIQSYLGNCLFWQCFSADIVKYWTFCFRNFRKNWKPFCYILFLNVCLMVLSCSSVCKFGAWRPLCQFGAWRPLYIWYDRRSWISL